MSWQICVPHASQGAYLSIHRISYYDLVYTLSECFLPEKKKRETGVHLKFYRFFSCDNNVVREKEKKIKNQRKLKLMGGTVF